MKRTISWILTVAMILGLMAIVPLSVSADDPSTVGTVEAGYTPTGTAINNETEFAAMAADQAYYLAADITLSASYASAFTGTLDGNGKVITTSVPIFTELKGTVKNLIIGGNVDGTAVAGATGALAKTGVGVTVTNVRNTAEVTGFKTAYEGAYATFTHRLPATGGFIGSITGVNAFTDCENSGDIIGMAVGGYVGIIGEDAYTPGEGEGATPVFALVSEVTFDGCINNGEITDEGCTDATNAPNYAGENCGAGGLLGFAIDAKTITMTDCSNSGVINTVAHAKIPAGGMFGQATVTNEEKIMVGDFYMTGCENTGSVTGSGQTGGLVGWIGYLAGHIENCKNSGSVKSTTSYCGGLIGRLSEYSKDCYIKNCTNEETATMDSFTGQVGGIVGYGAGEGGFLIENCLNKAPITVSVTTAVHGGGIVGSCAGDSGTTLKDCNNEATVTVSGRAGGIIGYLNGPGSLVTNCHNKKSVESTAAGQTGGIVGWVGKEAIVENCTTAEGTTVKSSTSYAGGIVGRVGLDDKNGANYASLDESEINNCINRAEVYSNYTSEAGNCGGIVAYTRQNIQIDSCYNYGKITSPLNIAAGIVGYIGSGDKYSGISRVYNSGNFGEIVGGTETSDYASGVIGYAYSTGGNSGKYLDVKNCFNVGSVTAPARAAGILGYTNAQTLYINNCYATGALTATATYAISFNNSTTTEPTDYVIANNYYPADLAQFANYYLSENKAMEPNMEAADLASGKLCYNINAAIKAADATAADAFYQTIGTDTIPLPDSTHKSVILVGETYLNDGKYSVTWSVNGVDTVAEYNAGETPAFTGSTDKPEDDSFTYAFTGWDKEIAMVTGDVKYTAQYSSIPKGGDFVVTSSAGVAKVYTTIEAAIAAIADGDTFSIAADVTLTAPVVIEKTGIKFTINGGNFNINYTGANFAFVFKTPSSTVSIENLKLTSAKGGIILRSNADAASKSVFNIKNSEITTNGGVGILYLQYWDINVDTVKITSSSNGMQATTYTAVAADADEAVGFNNLVVKNATIDAKGYGIYLRLNSTLDLSDSTLTVTNTGVQMITSYAKETGSVSTLKNVNITATKAYCIVTNPFNKVYIDGGNYISSTKDAAINISGIYAYGEIKSGNFECDQNCAARAYRNDGAKAADGASAYTYLTDGSDHATLDILGGTFTYTAASAGSAIRGGTGAQPGTVNISGGTFITKAGTGAVVNGANELNITNITGGTFINEGENDVAAFAKTGTTGHETINFPAGTKTFTYAKYTVTWSVNGTDTTVEYLVGSMPAFEGSTDKAEDAENTYTFTGWDKELAIVTADVKYTAQYSSTPKASDTTTETPEDTTTETPEDTTTETPEDTTTEAPGSDNTTTTEAPGGDDTTTTEAPGNDAPAEEGCSGCGGIAVFAQIIAIVCGIFAFAIIKRK